MDQNIIIYYLLMSFYVIYYIQILFVGEMHVSYTNELLL